MLSETFISRIIGAHSTPVVVYACCCSVMQSPSCNTCSAAIMTYLVDKYHLPDHWYPKDLQKRAKVDEYLHWHHNNLRKEAKLFYYKVSACNHHYSPICLVCGSTLPLYDSLYL